MSLEIKDKQLSRIITLRMCTENKTELSEIEEISIVNKNFLDQDLNIDLTEISKLDNIKKISIKFFDITDEVVDALNKLEKLETLEILLCKVNTAKTIKNNLKKLTIYNTENFKVNLVESEKIEILRIENSGLIDSYDISKYKNLTRLEIVKGQIISIPKLSLLKNLEELYLNEINLQFNLEITGMEKLKLISLNGSKVENKNDYIKNIKEQNKNVKIYFNENNLPIQ